MVARLSEAVGEFVSDHVLERTEDLLDRSERLSREEFLETIGDRAMVSGSAGKLGAGLVSLLAGHDVEIGLDVATNAVENNLIPALVVGGLMAWEAYELVQTLRHEGVEAAALRLGFTVGTAIVGGVAMKGLWKMGKIIAPTAGEAIALYMVEHPVLGKLVEKGMDLGSKGMDKFRQFDGKLDHAVGKIIPTKWKAGKQPVVKMWEGSKNSLEKTDLTYDYSTPHAPYSLRICPKENKGPMHVNSQEFTKADSYSRLGAPRNQKEFWRLWDNKYPGTLSKDNLSYANQGRAPFVDEQWLKFFPEHQRFIGQQIEHHHIDHSFLTTPLPRELHRGKGNSTYWHTNGSNKK